MEITNTGLMIVLEAYIKEWISLENLQEWFSTNVWDLLDSQSPLDRMVVGELQIAIAEFDRGDRNEEYLRKISTGLFFIVKSVQQALISSSETVMV